VNVEGAKHIIQCHCILPQYRNRPDPVFHKFVVFSEINDDEVKEKYSQCNNCGVVHKITDICKSEIVINVEDLPTLITKLDIKISLPNDLCDILEEYKVDISTWEHAKFIFDNKKWDEKILLSRSDTESRQEGKFLKILYFDRFTVEAVGSDSFIGAEYDS
jgi:hypothetical protein